MSEKTLKTKEKLDSKIKELKEDLKYNSPAPTGFLMFFLAFAIGGFFMQLIYKYSYLMTNEGFRIMLIMFYFIFFGVFIFTIIINIILFIINKSINKDLKLLLEIKKWKN